MNYALKLLLVFGIMAIQSCISWHLLEALLILSLQSKHVNDVSNGLVEESPTERKGGSYHEKYLHQNNTDLN